MTIHYIRHIFADDERGMPVSTDQERSAVICDKCGKKVEFVNEIGHWLQALESNGMTKWLRPDGMGHICVEHLK